MKKITTIKQLDSFISMGMPLFWYSDIFQCGFEIEYIDRSTFSFRHIECRFKGLNGKQTIQLSDIYTK